MHASEKRVAALLLLDHLLPTGGTFGKNLRAHEG